MVDIQGKYNTVKVFNRSDAKNSISMKDYKDAMNGIFHFVYHEAW